MDVAMDAPHPLPYVVYSCSSASTTYHPLHIFEDRPLDQSSRWSGTGPHQHFPPAVHGRPAGSAAAAEWLTEPIPSPSEGPAASASTGSINLAAAGARRKEYIMLDLGQPCVVRGITMGKHHRPHPCNVKEFKVWGGLSPGEKPGDFSTIESGEHQAVSGGVAQTLGGKRVKAHGERIKGGQKMELLLHGELKNDTVNETFRLRWRTDDGVVMPVQYIRIEPMYAAGSNYNLSIWYVALTGYDEGEIVDPVMEAYEQWRNERSLKLTLKHLRQTGHLSAFRALLSSVSRGSPFPSSVPARPFVFEHPLLSSLHTALVVRGDFAESERILSSAAFHQPTSLFSTYLGSHAPSLSCFPLRYDEVADADGNVPRGRGGHGMAIDERRRKIWLLGGFDGLNELGDLWVFDMTSSRWRLVCPNCEDVGGPSPRSCHVLVVDPATGDLYTLGRFAERADLRAKRERKQAKAMAKEAGERAASTAEREGLSEEQVSRAREQAAKMVMEEKEAEPDKMSYTGDFWRYSPDLAKWECLSFDTYIEGGPQMIHDHQMVLDADSRRLYVFGGKRVLSDPGPTDDYSGLYTYDLGTRTWMLRLQDPTGGDPFQPKRLLSRIGHSFVLDKARDCLWIFAGERSGSYHADLWRYSLSSHQAELVTEDYTAEHGGPEAGFSQRTAFDPEADEWHMFCGLCRESATSTKRENMTSEFWVWRLKQKTWWKVPIPLEEDGMEAPGPRYAHQMVFDPQTKDHYVFGGNPAETDSEPSRLADFWRLHLNRPTADEVLRRALFALRRQQFIEMAASPDRPVSDPMSALLFLQTNLAAVTDHANEKEARTFRACMAHLLSSSAAAGGPGAGHVSPMASSSRSVSRLDDMVTDDDVAAAAAAHDPMSASSVSSKRGGGGRGVEDEDEQAVKVDKRTWDERTAVFQELCAYFDVTQRQPDDELANLIDVFGDRDMFLT